MVYCDDEYGNLDADDEDWDPICGFKYLNEEWVGPCKEGRFAYPDEDYSENDDDEGEEEH